MARRSDGPAIASSLMSASAAAVSTALFAELTARLDASKLSSVNSLPSWRGWKGVELSSLTVVKQYRDRSLGIKFRFGLSGPSTTNRAIHLLMLTRIRRDLSN